MSFKNDKKLKNKTKCGRPQAFDWIRWNAAFQELRKATKVSLAKFCRVEGLPYDTARKAFKSINGRKAEKRSNSESEILKGNRRRHNWEAYRIEFLEVGFQTLSEFARHKNISRHSATFKKRTKGWLKDRDKILANAKAQKMAELQEISAKEEVGALHGRVLQILYHCLEIFENVKAKVEDVSVITPRDAKDYVGIANEMIKGLSAAMPVIAGIEGIDHSKSLLEDFLSGKIDAKELGARWFLSMGSDLPDGVKFGVEHSVEAPDDDDGQILTDEELERRYLEGLKRIEEQAKVFVPQRQDEVRIFKEEYKVQKSSSQARI